MTREKARKALLDNGIMWPFRRRVPMPEMVSLKPKNWCYIQIRIEVGKETDKCLKKASWFVPFRKRIKGR